MTTKKETMDQSTNNTKGNNLEEIIKNSNQIFMRFCENKNEEKKEYLRDLIIGLEKRYFNKVKIHTLKYINGILIDYSDLNIKEKEKLYNYLVNKKITENCVIEPLGKISYD